MQDTELVVTATLCFGGEIFIFKRKIHIPSLRERVFWCVAKAQSIIILIFLQEDYYVQEIDLSNLLFVGLGDS